MYLKPSQHGIKSCKVFAVQPFPNQMPLESGNNLEVGQNHYSPPAKGVENESPRWPYGPLGRIFPYRNQ